MNEELSVKVWCNALYYSEEADAKAEKREGR